MTDIIEDGKFVELTYKVIDAKTEMVLTSVEFPLGYIHGHTEVLAPFVHRQLEGKKEADIIDVPIDGNAIYGARLHGSDRKRPRRIPQDRQLDPDGKRQRSDQELFGHTNG